MLNFVKRDIQVINDYLTEVYCLNEIHAVWWETIQKIYNQQQYMYDNRTHSVSDRISLEYSFSQLKRCFSMRFILIANWHLGQKSD